MPESQPKQAVLLYAIISLVSFLCGVGLLFLMLWKVDSLVSLGLSGNLYYIVLLPLSLAAAGFLFGVLNSYAHYRGRQLGGVLELGGPIIAAALVVIGGFVLVPKPGTFAITVYVHGEGGVHDMVLKKSGYVVLDLGPDRRREPISDKGQAYFPSIPPTFKGQGVAVWVDSDNFEPVDAGKKLKLDSASLYLPVQKKGGAISGRIQNREGDPIQGAKISVANMSTTTDALGHFEIKVPGRLMAAEFDLFVSSPGYLSSRYKVVPNSNPLTATLRRLP
jgi:hypothetical protein